MTQYRSISPENVELREEDGRHYVRARVCNYGVADSFNTSWAPGVFKRSLENRLPKCAFAHDDKRIIGKVISYNDTPEGLEVEVRMSDFADNPDARRMYAHLRDGEIDAWSFWFRNEISEPDPKLRGVTQFTSADLIEVSPVLAASIPGTATIQVRADVADSSSSLGSFIKRPQMKGHLFAAKKDDPHKCSVCGGIKNSPHHKLRAMERTPHPFLPMSEDIRCGGCWQERDVKTHVARGADPTHLRDLSVSLASEPPESPYEDVESAIVDAGDALDKAIGLASYQNFRELPAWVSQVVSLVLAADVAMDEAREQLGLSLPEEATESELRALDLSYVPEPPGPTADDLALLDRLKVLGRRKL